MNFGIKYKLLVTFFAATVAVVGCMLFLMYWSFERGFLQYVNTVEQEVHDNLITSLVDAYKKQAGWEFLLDNRQLWRELQISSMLKSESVRKHLGRSADSSNLLQAPHLVGYAPDGHQSTQNEWYRRHQQRLAEAMTGMPRGSFRFRSRLALLDKDENIVVGRIKDRQGIKLKPIKLGDELVGYLAARPRKELYDIHELRFTQKQGRTFSLIALFTIIIATLVILPLSRNLVRPIKKVTSATRELASGNYDVRITVSSNDEIGQLSKDFNTLANTLKKNETVRQQWIADISHELRTPLSILRGEIESLQDGVRDVTPERLASLHSEVMNLGKLTDDLYELSLSDIGALSYRKQSLDLGEALTVSLQNLQAEFSAKHISVSIETEIQAQIRVFADPVRLRQLFTNLYTNSLRYTREDGELKIVVQVQDDTVTIDFMDSAAAVTADDLPRLFDRLYRVDSSRNRLAGGAGLGLSICKNIVEAHDGEISAQPSPLGGLWIRIELPRES